MKPCVRWKQKLWAKTLSISHLNKVNKHHKKVLYTTTFLTQSHRDNTGRPVPALRLWGRRKEIWTSFPALWLRATLTINSWNRLGYQSALNSRFPQGEAICSEKREISSACRFSSWVPNFTRSRVFLALITKLFGHAWPLIVSCDKSGWGMEKVVLLICVTT